MKKQLDTQTEKPDFLNAETEKPIWKMTKIVKPKTPTPFSFKKKNEITDKCSSILDTTNYYHNEQ